MVNSNEYGTLVVWLGILLFTLPVWALVSRKIIRRHFWCPWKKTEVEVDFVATRFGKKNIKVFSCSALSKEGAALHAGMRGGFPYKVHPGTSMDCNKKCLDLPLEQSTATEHLETQRWREKESERDVRRWTF